jgi:hypothetical protein
MLNACSTLLLRGCFLINRCQNSTHPCLWLKSTLLAPSQVQQLVVMVTLLVLQVAEAGMPAAAAAAAAAACCTVVMQAVQFSWHWPSCRTAYQRAMTHCRVQSPAGNASALSFRLSSPGHE